MKYIAKYIYLYISFSTMSISYIAQYFLIAHSNGFCYISILKQT